MTQMNGSAGATGVTPLYAAVDGRMAGLGTDEAVFFDAATGRSHVMTQDVARSLGLCRGFLTMAEHVRRIQETMPALKGQDAAVERVLSLFVRDGLLQTDAQFAAGFAAGEALEQAPVSGIFLIAGASTASLVAALQALARHGERFGLPGPVFLLDFQDDRLTASQHREAIEDEISTSGLDVRHVDNARAQRVLDAITGEHPGLAPALRFLLPPEGTGEGAARNLVALLAAGTRHIVLHADTALPLLQHPETMAGLYPDARAFATRSFASPEEAWQAGVALEEDPLAAHLAACGTSLAAAMATQPLATLGAGSLHGVVPEQASWLRPECRVAFTSVGRAGRFAPSDPTFVFRLDATARAGLVASREAWLNGRRTPVIWTGVRNFAVGQGDSLTTLAVDGSRLVPCTLPRVRRASELQVMLWRLTDPDLTSLGFPQALHQLEPGPGSEDELGRPDTAQCLSGFVGFVASDLRAQDPALRLAVMAARLQDLAGGSDAALVSYLQEYLAFHRSSAIEHMQRALAAAKEPPLHWVADLRSAVEAQGKALIAGEVPRLAGWPQPIGPTGCAARFREELGILAGGLGAWPTVFAHAVAHSAAWRDAIAA